jgi:ATP/maltotriose-dependent transcriptional regulator MalT
MIKLIDSKLQPPHLGSSVIKRTRLIERLQSNLGLCATFVCAGPGWGKTTLTAELLDTLDIPAVWYDLDATDADIAVFFRYLVRTLQQALPNFGNSTIDLLRSGGGARYEQLADLFLFELAEAVDRELVVVLDNIHCTFSTEWSSPVLYRILQLLPKGVHFILLARMAPGFTFSRMRSKQTLDQIDDRDLAFTRNEVSELFRPVFDDEDTLNKLLGWTQGWVAGLQIIRKAVESDCSLRSLEVDEIITRSESEIFDYFATKVYQAEPREIREFLVRSSLPYHVTQELLTEALGMDVSSEQLQAAVRENVFLTRLSGESDTYTFHPLFRDFLRKQLEAEITAAQLREFHRSLAKYYAARENWGLALYHFFEAGDESGATETMLNAEQPLLAAGLASTLGSYLPRFSQLTLDRHPQLYNLMGEARIIEGDSVGADEKFRLALDAARIDGDREVEASALAGLAHSAAREHNFKEAIAHAEAAEQCVMQTGNLPDKAALRARVKNVAGAVRVFEGRYIEANDLMEEALRLAHEAADVRLIRSISHNLALPAFMEGDFHAALRYFSRSPISEISGSRRVLHPDSILLYLNRAAVYTALGKLENAARDLGSADELATVFRLRGFVPRIIEGRANLARERRDFNEADKLYDDALEEYRSVGSDPAKSDLNYERALLELRRNETTRALELIDEMVRDRHENGREIELALAQQMRGRVLLELGDPRAIDEANASQPLLRRLQCNYYLAIGCYLSARALFGRDVEGGRLALVEFLQLGERFDYSYFTRTEEWFHPALAGLCRRYSIDSPWLNLMLTPNKYATGTER